MRVDARPGGSAVKHHDESYSSAATTATPGAGGAAAPPSQDGELHAFLGQFDSMIQAYGRFLQQGGQPVPTQPQEKQAKACQACGVSIAHTDKFCPNCGAPQDIPLQASHALSDDSAGSATSLGADVHSREELARAATEFILKHTQPQQQAPPPPNPKPNVAAQEKVLAAASPPGFDVGIVRGLMTRTGDDHTRSPARAGTPTSRRAQAQPGFHHNPNSYAARHNQERGRRGHTPKRVPPPADSVLDVHSRHADSSGVSHGTARSGSAGRAVSRRGRHTTPAGRTPRGVLNDSSFVSNASATSKRSYSEKARMRDQNRTDPALISGYFLPDDLRGSASFSKTPRFRRPCGFSDEQTPNYFLDESVAVDIKRNRSRSVPNKLSSTSSRGKAGNNVTSRWGLREVASPGPGSYNPRYAKAR
eukprot:TRINITY_DN3968_c1_g1_i1.p1 TRINITY_DN3968_c1_g1~~TRINITY_DN3968_c1_g1_i1.p1  ORF type:complete len:419 (+),score=124.20 TRINITY_DN3968_c1_g1_i1:78-1334(+)